VPQGATLAREEVHGEKEGQAAEEIKEARSNKGTQTEVLMICALQKDGHP
jgi:hypothetical protein